MAKKDRLPWFPFYPKDWLDVKVLTMTLEEQGAYIRILAHMWADSKDQCSITNDHQALARLLGITSKKMKKFFEKWQAPETNLFTESEKNRYTSNKLLEIKNSASKLSKARSIAGVSGSKKRWKKDSKPIAKPCQTDSKAIAKPITKNSYNTIHNTHNRIREEEEGKEGIPTHLIKMVELARKAKIPNRLPTLINYLDAWIVRVGETEVQDILGLDEIKGLNIIQLEDQYFSQKVKAEPSDISAMIQDALKKPITGS